MKKISHSRAVYEVNLSEEHETVPGSSPTGDIKARRQEEMPGKTAVVLSQSPRKEEEPKFKFTKFPVRNQEAKSTEEPCTTLSHVKWQRYVLWMQKKMKYSRITVCLLHRHDQIKLHFHCCLLASVLAPVLSLVSVCVSCKRKSSFYMFSSRVFGGGEGRPRSCGLWNQCNVLARIK